MWIVRTRARFNFWNRGYSYRTQILIPGVFEPFDWLTKGNGQAASNFKYAFDPKGFDAKPKSIGGAYKAYQDAYRSAGTIMALPYEQMPKDLRRSDSFANYQKQLYYEALVGRTYFGDDFREFQEDKKAFGDNKFWNDYEKNEGSGDFDIPPDGTIPF